MTLTTLIIAMTAVISPGVSTLGPNPCATSSEWPLWDTYVSAFVSPDGRVVDPMFDDHSTSEGQAYALFFALVNDKMIVKSFDMGIGGGVPSLADAQASID